MKRVNRVTRTILKNKCNYKPLDKEEYFIHETGTVGFKIETIRDFKIKDIIIEIKK